MDSQLEAFEKFRSTGGPAKRPPFGDRPRDNGPMPDLYSIHQGNVVRIEDFGAFVEIPGFRRHGLVHKKQASKHFTENVSDVVAVGDKVWVKVTSLQDDKIALSMKYVSQGDGQDLDPNLIQQTGEQDRKRVHGGFIDKAPISIEKGGVLLKTVCKKCGAAGHLAVECFSMGEKFDLLEDNDEEDNLIMQAVASGRGDKDKKKKEKSRDKDRKRDHKEKPSSSSSSSRHKESRRGRSRSQSPRRRNEDPKDAKVESLEDALALMRSRKQRKSKHRDDSPSSEDDRRHHKRSSKSRRSRSRSRSRSPARPRKRSRSRSRSRSPKRRSSSHRDDYDRSDRSDRHGHRR